MQTESERKTQSCTLTMYSHDLIHRIYANLAIQTNRTKGNKLSVLLILNYGIWLLHFYVDDGPVNGPCYVKSRLADCTYYTRRVVRTASMKESIIYAWSCWYEAHILLWDFVVQLYMKGSATALPRVEELKLSIWTLQLGQKLELIPVLRKTGVTHMYSESLEHSALWQHLITNTACSGRGP